MLRDLSESLFDFLIDAFPAVQSYAREDFEQDPMPPLLAHFLTQTLHHRLDTEVEQLRSVRTTWFDYDHEEVQHAYKQLVASLAQHAVIPEEEWRGTLKRATKVVFAHLVLPAHTLVEFVFRDDEKPLMAPVLYKQLGYFAAYPYLREAVEAFMTRRGMDAIDRQRFASLLAQIDRHMMSGFTSDDWLRLLRPLFDLVNRLPNRRGQGVPIELLSMFFGDKDAYEIQGRLQVEKEVRRAESLNEEALRNVLEGSVEPFEQTATAREPVAPPPSPSVLSPSPKASIDPMPAPVEPVAPPTHPSPPVSPSPPATPNGPKPLWQQFQQHREPNPAPAPARPDKPDDAVPLWQRFQQPGKAEPSATPGSQNTNPPAPAAENVSAGNGHSPSAAFTPTLQDLAQLERQVLGPQGITNRGIYIEHLFLGSSADYARTLNELRHVPDWAQASQFIADRVFKRYQINIYSPAALMFTDNVQARYKAAR